MGGLGRLRLNEITPQRIFSALRARISEIPHAWMWKYAASSEANRLLLQNFHNKYNGKRCFIVANGPSLQRTNLDLLSSEISFGLNRIYLNFERSAFRPSFLVVVNELILEQCAAEIKEVKIPKFLNWNRRDYFGPPNAEQVYLKSRMVINDYFETDLTRPMVFGATVTFATLQLAYFMGFRQVILVGLDHNYREKGVPSKVEVRQSEKDESHFDPKYFPRGFKWQLPDLLRSEIEYQLAREIFENGGREILDATIDGKCEIFKKVQFESLLIK